MNIQGFRVGDKSKDTEGWFIILNSLNSNLVKARVGDEIFYTTCNSGVRLSKITAIKKKLDVGGKYPIKPSKCIVKLNYVRR